MKPLRNGSLTRLYDQTRWLMAMGALCLMLAGCHSQQTAVKDNDTAKTTITHDQLLNKVSKQTTGANFIASKIKFTIEQGSKKISVSGSLRMKRDDVIRLQLMAPLGIMEVGRMEFTDSEVLIVDRINKQYLKAPYSQVSFLAENGINFHTLQSLFWDEFFVPGKNKVEEKDLDLFQVNRQSSTAEISTTKNKLDYHWTVNAQNSTIQQARIVFQNAQTGNTQLKWNYTEFSNMGKGMFPGNIAIQLAAPQKEVKVDIKLSGTNNDSDWETRTTVSNKYKQVTAEDILKQLIHL